MPHYYELVGTLSLQRAANNRNGNHNVSIAEQLTLAQIPQFLPPQRYSSAAARNIYHAAMPRA
jgi:hypothetical protein